MLNISPRLVDSNLDLSRQCTKHTNEAINKCLKRNGNNKSCNALPIQYSSLHLQAVIPDNKQI
jgi:hypothetical protein